MEVRNNLTGINNNVRERGLEQKFLNAENQGKKTRSGVKGIKVRRWSSLEGSVSSRASAVKHDVYFVTDPKLLRSFEAPDPVHGLAVLDKKLYVLRKRQTDQVKQMSM